MPVLFTPKAKTQEAKTKPKPKSKNVFQICSYLCCVSGSSIWGLAYKHVDMDTNRTERRNITYRMLFTPCVLFHARFASPAELKNKKLRLLIKKAVAGLYILRRTDCVQ